MTAIHAKSALLADGWRNDVRFEIAEGCFSRITTGTEPEPDDDCRDVVIPAMPNLHSHAFQRAMAGLAEIRGPSEDTFWSWRTVMYKFVLNMTPDHVEAVAAQLYMEMLEAGFCRVGEFHYLHNDRDGTHYGNIAEMAERIAAASAETGIELTLLPTFYAHSNFGGLPPLDGQRRFIHSPDSFSRMMENSAAIIAALPNAVLGIAPHSLRAVTAEELRTILPLGGNGPIHIHAAEQTKEVEDCLAWSGARPVEWLVNNAAVDDRWCLIHATHMTDMETNGVAESGAVAGLCPITEANLGDGIFPAPAFIERNGRFGIGSDSNIQISIAGELRALEYAQRLSGRIRNVIAMPGGSTGRRLFDAALAGGHVALGVKGGGLRVGATANIVSLDKSATPYLLEDAVLDRWIFSDGVLVDAVWVAGRQQVSAGRHVRRDAITRRFKAAMADLLAR